MAEGLSGLVSGQQFQPTTVPYLKQAGIATMIYTNDADLSFVYDVTLQKSLLHLLPQTRLLADKMFALQRHRRRGQGINAATTRLTDSA